MIFRNPKESEGWCREGEGEGGGVGRGKESEGGVGRGKGRREEGREGEGGMKVYYQVLIFTPSDFNHT